MPGRKGGRPTLCTPERIASIREDLLLGMTREAAAARAGVPRSTLQTWLAYAAEGKRPFADFAAALEAAEAESQRRFLGTIIRASQPRKPERGQMAGQWQAAAWVLERRWPAAWRQRADPQPAPDALPDGTVRVPTSADEAVEVLAAIPETLWQAAACRRERNASTPPEVP